MVLPGILHWEPILNAGRWWHNHLPGTRSKRQDAFANRNSSTAMGRRELLALPLRYTGHNDRTISCDARASCQHGIRNQPLPHSPISLGIHTGMQLMSAGRCCRCHARIAHSQGQYQEQACLSGSRSITESWKKRNPSLSSMQALRPMRWFLSQHAPHEMHVAMEEKWREH